VEINYWSIREFSTPRYFGEFGDIVANKAKTARKAHSDITMFYQYKRTNMCITKILNSQRHAPKLNGTLRNSTARWTTLEHAEFPNGTQQHELFYLEIAWPLEIIT
jgi:hypothetical protein